jgi:hypothetical protein
MDEIINKWPLIQEILLYVIGFNAALAGLKAGLDKIKDATQSSLDNKTAEFLGKVVGWVTKIIDIIGFNPKHK